MLGKCLAVPAFFGHVLCSAFLYINKAIGSKMVEVISLRGSYFRLEFSLACKSLQANLYKNKENLINDSDVSA